MTPAEQLDRRVEEVAVTVKNLMPVGVDFVLIGWDGSGNASVSSSVPASRLREVLAELRGDALEVDGLLADMSVAATDDVEVERAIFGEDLDDQWSCSNCDVELVDDGDPVVDNILSAGMCPRCGERLVRS